MGSPYTPQFMDPAQLRVTGPGGYSAGLNPLYYATDASAQALAQMMGGNVMSANPLTAGSPYSAPNMNMITLPNGVQVDAGIVSNLFNQYGQSPQYLQQLLGNIEAGSGTPGSFMPVQNVQTLSAAGQPAPATPGMWSTPQGPQALAPSISSTGPGQYSTSWAPFGGQGYATPTFNPITWNMPQASQPSQVYQPQSMFGAGLGMQSPGAGVYNPVRAQQDAGVFPALGPVTPDGTMGATPGTSPVLGTTPSAGATGGGADQFLSGLAQSGMGGLQSIVAGAGNPIDQLPAWQSMVAAQNRNIQEQQANLAEQFNVSGNRFGSAFGTAATDFQNQATLQQNALLGQMTAQAGEAAQQRLLSAAGALGQYGYGAGAQLSGQDFQSQMQQFGLGAQAAMQMAGGADTAAAQLAQLGYSGLSSMYGAQNNAIANMFGNQNATLGQFMNYDIAGQGLGTSAANALSGAYNQTLAQGMDFGQTQYNQQQSAINNAYQQWLYQQPQNNPLLNQMFSLATYYPSMVQPGFQPGILGSLMSGAGSILGGLGAIGVSDVRVKENILPIGRTDDVNWYEFNYTGDPARRVGTIAQELLHTHPEAVYVNAADPGRRPLAVDYALLDRVLAARN